jgi:hypothetical protein
LKIRVQPQFDQIAALKFLRKHEARAAGDMVALDRHSLDKVIIVRQEGLEIPRLRLAGDAKLGPEVRCQAGARQRQAGEFGG